MIGLLRFAVSCFFGRVSYSIYLGISVFVFLVCFSLNESGEKRLDLRRTL